jgi:hypothetical protein
LPEASLEAPVDVPLAVSLCAGLADELALSKLCPPPLEKTEPAGSR